MSVALVTGASRGIGLAVAKGFAQAGYRVATSARTKPDFGDWTCACDLTDPEAARAMVRAAAAALSGLDVVINNAGLSGHNTLGDELNPPTGEIDPPNDALWHQIIATSLHATYYVSSAALPYLRDGGRIINMASVLAFKAVADQTAYVAAKHAVLGFTKSLALHLAPRKITVNAICPGWTRTDMAERRAVELGTTVAALQSGIPTGRITEPEELAALALYLASPGAQNVTGQALTVDGGQNL